MCASPCIAEHVPLRFSILTPTLNRHAMLGEAVASVAGQGWPDVEHIVADGGSTDGTPEMLAGAANLRVLPGPDAGIYDGLNKAMAAARGDIIGWLNSDDLYAPGAFAAAAAAFEARPELAALCGSAQIEAGGVAERVYASEDVADLSPGAVLIGPTLPNAWFFRRAVFDAVGPFDTNLSFAADSDFMLRFAKTGLPHAATTALFYRYRRHAGSATLQGAPRAVREDMLRLALKWRDDPDPRVSATARALEGRCRAMLALGALSEGRVADATTHLRHAPSIVSGIGDYVKRGLDPSLRRRRFGEPPASPTSRADRTSRS
jgi:glycosyltransferase involved in cell wall biosynthesis